MKICQRCDIKVNDVLLCDHSSSLSYPPPVRCGSIIIRRGGFSYSVDMDDVSTASCLMGIACFQVSPARFVPCSRADSGSGLGLIYLLAAPFCSILTGARVYFTAIIILLRPAGQPLAIAGNCHDLHGRRELALGSCNSSFHCNGHTRLEGRDGLGNVRVRWILMEFV